MSVMSMLSLWGAAAVLLLLAYWDLSKRRLPHLWTGIYAVLFLAYAGASGMGWEQLAWHTGIAMLAVVLTALLFARGVMGGGDVKLWGALMLWAGAQGAVAALVIATLCGGLMGVVGWGAKHILKHDRRPAGAGLLRMLSASRGVPYGVGLAVAGLQNLWVLGS